MNIRKTISLGLLLLLSPGAIFGQKDHSYVFKERDILGKLSMNDACDKQFKGPFDLIYQSIKEQKSFIPNNSCVWYTLKDKDVALTTLKDGHYLLFPKNDFYYNLAVYYGTMEPLLGNLLERLTKPGDFIVDVGANTGIISFPFARKAGPTGRVVCIEASPEVEQLLTIGSQLNGYTNIDSFNLAAFDQNDLSLFFSVSKSSSLLSSLSTDGGQDKDSVEVKGVRVDDFIKKTYRRDTADILRVDIEGAEAPAILGASRLIENSKNLLLSFEWQKKEMERYSSPEQLREMVMFIHEQGFRMWRVTKTFTSYKLTDKDVDNQTLELIYPEELLRSPRDELFASRDLFLFEGLYDKMNIDYNDFWSLPFQKQVFLIENNRLNINAKDHNGKHMLDRIVELPTLKATNETKFKEELSIIEKLVKIGEKCSSQILNLKNNESLTEIISKHC